MRTMQATAETRIKEGETMTQTDKRRIQRYQKLLETLRRSERLLLDCEIPDGGTALMRTRQNIMSVETLLHRWQGAA